MPYVGIFPQDFIEAILVGGRQDNAPPPHHVGVTHHLEEVPILIATAVRDRAGFQYPGELPCDQRPTMIDSGSRGPCPSARVDGLRRTEVKPDSLAGQLAPTRRAGPGGGGRPT